MTLSQAYKVAAKLPQPSYFRMGSEAASDVEIKWCIEN